MKINTSLFVRLVNKANKCSSNNKAIPLTTLMCIRVVGGKLNLITSNDEGYYLYVYSKTMPELADEDFYVTVYSEQLVKLVNKLTSESIELSVNDGVLDITAHNGKYKLELPLDENGDIIKYPDPMSGKDIDYNITVSLSDIKSVNNYNKTSLYIPEKDEPDNVYSYYYVGDKVVSTDSNKACSNNIELFSGCEPVLLSSTLLDLVKVMEDDTINVSINGDEIIFEQDNCILFGYIEDDIEDYEIDMIGSLCELNTNTKCKIYKSLLLETLDRLNLFVGPYDNKAIVLTFNKDYIEISSLKTSASEIISYEGLDDYTYFECKVPIDLLIEQISVIPSEVITIEYGNDKVIKFVNDDVVQVLALLQ